MTAKATKWDPEKLSSYDIRQHVPAHVVEIIDRPHDHEGDHNKPIWIIWKHRPGFPPIIDTLCDTADSAVYHYGMLAGEIVQRQGYSQTGASDVAFVERVPANHRFASSLNDVFSDPNFMKTKPIGRNARRYARDGD